MNVGLAALETGKLGLRELIHDKGVFEILGQRFTCLAASSGGHGDLDISHALQVSCNYFFYELANRQGIETMDKYAADFGLGGYTGIELGGDFGEEAQGILAGPESRKKNKDETMRQWYPGDTIQSGIGQSDNLFTPIQLANYAAALANGGTRYKTHLLKAVKSNALGRVVEEKKPEIAKKLDLNQENLDAVREGMRLVNRAGSASAAFADFPIETAGKTGTAEVGGKGSDNSVYVAFAPFDKPQIAVAVVVEHGAAGAEAAFVAKDIFSRYFIGAENEAFAPEPTYTLLP
jgi:penicillin-binding protein 2